MFSSQPEPTTPEESNVLTEKQRKKNRIVTIFEIIMGIVAIVLIVVALNMLFTTGGTVHLKVNAEGYSPADGNARLAIYNIDAYDLLTDDDPSNDPAPKTEVVAKVNQDQAVTEIISQGTYTLRISQAPTTSDASSYILPEPQVVNFEGGDITVEFNLVKQQ